MEIIQIKVGQLDTNCYILKAKKEAIIVDPGGDTEKILEKIEDQDVIIVNTHYHFDHTTANDDLKKKLNAKILIHESEKEYIDFEADKFLKEGDELEIDGKKLKVINTPGHSEGSICLLGDNFALTGDTLFDGGYGRTDLPGGEPAAMFKSLNRLNEILKNDMTIYPGHGEPFVWAE